MITHYRAIYTNSATTHFTVSIDARLIFSNLSIVYAFLSMSMTLKKILNLFLLLLLIIDLYDFDLYLAFFTVLYRMRHSLFVRLLIIKGTTCFTIFTTCIMKTFTLRNLEYFIYIYIFIKKIMLFY